MIAKCVALLAIVAQINAYGCNSNYGVGSGYGSVAVSPVAVGSVGVGSGIVGSGVVGSGVVGSGVVGSGIVGSGVVGSAGLARSAGTSYSTVTRNLVAKGKYPVALDNTGPVPDARVPVSTSHVQTPVQQKPTVRLSANIPSQKTVAHSCTCYKQIMRPRVHDQYITVPTVQRYVETTHTPVVENIHYEAVPVNDPTTVNGGVIGGQYASSAFPVSSGVQVGSFGPVSSGVQVASYSPVSSGVQVASFAPVSSGVQVASVSPVVSSVQVAPVASAVQVAPVASSVGCNGQGYYY